MAYKIGTHRHTPEIEQELSLLAGKKITLSFTPHLVPMNRAFLHDLCNQTAPQIRTSFMRCIGNFIKCAIHTAASGRPIPNVRDVRARTSVISVFMLIADRPGGCGYRHYNLVKGASARRSRI